MAGPKSKCAEDRRNGHGKGDLHRGPLEGYRNSSYFGRSNCCNAPVMKLQGKNCCEKCGEYCLKNKGE